MLHVYIKKNNCKIWFSSKKDVENPTLLLLSFTLRIDCTPGKQ